MKNSLRRKYTAAVATLCDRRLHAHLCGPAQKCNRLYVRHHSSLPLCRILTRALHRNGISLRNNRIDIRPIRQRSRRRIQPDCEPISPHPSNQNCRKGKLTSHSKRATAGRRRKPAIGITLISISPLICMWVETYFVVQLLGGLTSASCTRTWKLPSSVPLL